MDYRDGPALAKSGIYTVIGKTVSDLAAATTLALSTAQKTGAGNAGELAAAQYDLSGKLTEELVHVGTSPRPTASIWWALSAC